MKTQKKENSMSHWLGVLFGVGFSFLGAHKILTGEPGIRWGIPIPAWTGWVQLPVGIWALVVFTRALWRDRNKVEPVVNLDEEAARAEADLDAMYLRDHGELPEKPKKDT